MKALKAQRIKIKIGELWLSPMLHVLLTRENEVIVARCLDFTVSSHGANEREALKSLSEAIKEYILSSIEVGDTDNLFDPAHNKYWRMFNELEAKKLRTNLKRSLTKLIIMEAPERIEKTTVNIAYA